MAKILQGLERLLGLKKPSPEVVKGYKFVSEFNNEFLGSRNWELGRWYICDSVMVMGRNEFFDRRKLELGKWKVYDDSLNDNRIFHAYSDLHSAFSDVSVEDRLFEVEACDASSGKGAFAASKMRLVREIDLKRLSTDYAVNCARHVLPNYEKAFPEDDRPRKAIGAAENYLRDPSAGDLRAAARPSGSIWPDRIILSAFSARAAADSAVQSAEYANSAAKEKKWQKRLLEKLVQKYYI